MKISEIKVNTSRNLNCSLVFFLQITKNDDTSIFIVAEIVVIHLKSEQKKHSDISKVATLNNIYNTAYVYITNRKKKWSRHLFIVLMRQCKLHCVEIDEFSRKIIVDSKHIGKNHCVGSLSMFFENTANFWL